MAHADASSMSESEKIRPLHVTQQDPVECTSGSNSVLLPHRGSHVSNGDSGSDGDWVEEPDSDGDGLGFKSFFDQTCFASLPEVLDSDRKEHGFYFPEFLLHLDQASRSPHRSDAGVDSFIDVTDTITVIKIINLIRAADELGLKDPLQYVLARTGGLAKDDYLQPALENDAVLMEADEIISLLPTKGEFSLATLDSEATDFDKLHSYSHEQLVQRISELTASRDDAVLALEKKRAEYDELAAKFNGHRELVERVLDKTWDVDDPSELRDSNVGPVKSKTGHLGTHDSDTHYFVSYSHPEIHKTMLNDRVRTDAYRDFVYENKHLFKGKVVLDVGCGTGILSMFCAKAGAERVYAVDNSAIIDKAKTIVKHNGFEDVITCIHGKVEDIDLPEKADIIISEWMGYGLLYEAMLDSVLVAKARFLAHDGLMVPSHTKMFIAPFAEPATLAEYKSEWKDVYDFNMDCMLEHAFDEALVEDLPASAQLLSSTGLAFHEINMGTANPPTSSFGEKPFRITLTKDTTLTGFCIWFDAIFMPDAAQDPVVVDGQSGRYAASGSGEPVHSFSTGPSTPTTHWHQVLLMVDCGDEPAETLGEGDAVMGWVSYTVPDHNEREVDIEIEWGAAKRGSPMHRREWHLR